MLGEYKDINKVAFNILSNEIKNNKVKHAYLFDVSSSSNFFPFIYAFIKSILCPQNKIEQDGCNECNLCKTIDDNNFPDILLIEPDGNCIKKEQLLSLQSQFKTKSMYDNKKIYIIKYAEDLHVSAANSILKFLEEPENNIVAILLTKNINMVLPTIQSRCEIISLISAGKLDCFNEIQSLYNDVDITEIIDYLIKFILYYEKNGINTLGRTQKMWFEMFSDKRKNILALNMLMLFYKDALNKKLNRALEIYEDYENEVSSVSQNNTEASLCKKIKIILEHIDRNDFNINLSLNLDNLIIRMEE